MSLRKDIKFLVIIVVVILCFSLLEVNYSIDETVFDNKVEQLDTQTDKYDEDAKMIAITFDDGPGKYTSKLLEGLEERNAKVTFFLLGEKIAKYPKNAKMIIESGHLIGNHTYSHIDLTNYSTQRIQEEFNKTSDIIMDLGGTATAFCRPPYGAYSKKVLDALDVPIILWSVDTQDWKCKNAKQVAKYIKNNANDGDIVLLHELYETSIEGVLMAIDDMQKDGYVFVTVEELLLRNGESIESKTVYKSNKLNDKDFN
ncbi:MAG: polysaccharide deacetylase [Clostridiales bacterium]|nr:polysaccharide deacetylase [Clostridiales bacterium]